jgi:hypothetical protein
MTDKKNFREKDNDKQRGKKRYRERLVETQEAEREIKQYDWREPINQEQENTLINDRT